MELGLLLSVLNQYGSYREQDKETRIREINKETKKDKTIEKGETEKTEYTANQRSIK